MKTSIKSGLTEIDLEEYHLEPPKTIKIINGLSYAIAVDWFKQEDNFFIIIEREVHR